MSFPSERDALLPEAENEAKSLGAHAEWYGKFMNVISKKGEEWVGTETKRVAGLLDGDSLSAAKVDEFTIRKNVLSAFVKE